MNINMNISYRWFKLKAIAWLVLGRDEPALALFNHMLQRWPEDAYALASRAHLHAQGKRQHAAIADLSQLVQLQPGHAAHHFNLGFALDESGQVEAAVASFQRATELAPQLDRAWYGLGLALIRLRRFDEAVIALKRNTELQPMSPYGWYQLARVHADRHDPEAALQVIRHLQGFEPKVAAQLVRETGLFVGTKSA
jgi:tetratricopeptide (TPR) repeat protein